MAQKFDNSLLHSQPKPNQLHSTQGLVLSVSCPTLDLSEGPSTFMLVMNEVFTDLVDKGVIIYMDDFAFYSKLRVNI